MEQQLQRMQEAIDYIRMASDEKLHEIYLSLGAKSTKPQAVSATYQLRVLRHGSTQVLPHFDVPTNEATQGVVGQTNFLAQHVVVSIHEGSRTTTAFSNSGRAGGLVA